MLLVDTNVVAYLLIDGDRTALAQELWRRDADWRSEAFLLVEFTNVLATCVSAGRLTQALARNALARADDLFHDRLGRIDHEAALDAATTYRVSAYDGRFLALAKQLRVPLVTEDAKLRRDAPDFTISIQAAITSAR